LRVFGKETMKSLIGKTALTNIADKLNSKVELVPTFS
jgi:hypothetical protein